MNPCRACGCQTEQILDHGMQALANSFTRTPAEALRVARHRLLYGLCLRCGWVQLNDTVSPESLYRDYAYVTGKSELVAKHADALVKGAGTPGFMVEIASNDGTVASAFQRARWKVLGVEPARNIAPMAEEKGVQTLVDFFDSRVALQIRETRGEADLILARHVFGHAPDPHEMLRGAAVLLAPHGWLVIEMPYIGGVWRNREFDLFYSEHCSWPGVRSMSAVLKRHGLELQAIRFVPLHGGSILFLCGHDRSREVEPQVYAKGEEESEWMDPEAWVGARADWNENLGRIAQWLETERAHGRLIAGYGAPAKASVLAQCMGLTMKEMPWVADWSESKIGRYQPGTAIPIVAPEYANHEAPDAFLLFSWNLRDEIVPRERRWKFWTPVPRLEECK